MAKRDERMKASDLFRERPPAFGKLVSFKEAFPVIVELDVTVTEKGSGVFGDSAMSPMGSPIREQIDSAL